MSTLVALAWPFVALVAIFYFAGEVRVLFTQRSLLTTQCDALLKRTEALENARRADREEGRIVLDLKNQQMDGLAKSIEKLERLNQGVAPKAERHTPEQLARFR